MFGIQLALHIINGKQKQSFPTLFHIANRALISTPYLLNLKEKEKEMSKRLLKWSVDKTVLTMHDAVEEKVMATFDLSDIWPDFLDMGEVQKHVVVYGVKQLLADTGASLKTADDKKIAATEKWSLLKNGKISVPRSNATGATENRRIATEIRERSKIVSLEGLMAKKLLDESNFTADDQKKLDELLLAQAEILKRNK